MTASSVIATGGGIILSAENRASIERKWPGNLSVCHQRTALRENPQRQKQASLQVDDRKGSDR